jgi:hypothetical protein
MLGSVARRERLPLWALVSFVAVLGFAVSAILAQAARNVALDGVVDRARDARQLLTDTIPDKQLADPIKGASYDRLAKKISRSVSADGSSVGVTVWSSRGRVLFSLNETSVGTSDREMRPLIADMTDGSGSYRVTGTTVRAFVPVPLLANDQALLVEVDEPLAAVEARVGNVWTILRVVFGLGLAVSLLLLGLSFFSSMKREAAHEDAESARDHGPHEEEAAEAKAVETGIGDRVPERSVPEAAETEPSDVERRATAAPKEEPVTERPTASFTEALEALQALQPDLEHAIHQDEPPHDGAAAQGEAADHAAAEDAVEEVRDDAARTDEAPDGELAAQELLRKRREEFKARAEKAELRVKKQEAELQEAGSGPKSEQ